MAEDVAPTSKDAQVNAILAELNNGAPPMETILKLRKLADEHGFAYISTGEIFRLFLTGHRRAEMLEGKLMSDQETIDMLDKVLDIIIRLGSLFSMASAYQPGEWLMRQVENGRFGKPTVVHMDVSERNTRASCKAWSSRRHRRGHYRRYRHASKTRLAAIRDGGVTVLDVNADGAPTGFT
jgi:hypothetical protein